MQEQNTPITPPETERTQKKGTAKKRLKMLLVVIVLLGLGFTAGYFVARQTKSKVNSEQTTQDTTQQTAEEAADEPFEAAPVMQAPEATNKTEAAATTPLKVEAQDAILTTYTYTGTDQKSYTKTVVMTKVAVTNTTAQAIPFDVYPLNLKDKNNELMNATFYAFMPEQLSWYGGYLHTQTIPAKQTVVGIVTMEIPAGTYNSEKAPLKLRIDNLDKTLEVTPREVTNPY